MKGYKEMSKSIAGPLSSRGGKQGIFQVLTKNNTQLTSLGKRGTIDSNLPKINRIMTGLKSPMGVEVNRMSYGGVKSTRSGVKGNNNYDD